MSEKPWDGRFSQSTDKLVERFTSSIAVDCRLYAYDIEGSIAHCTMLAKVGVISDEERDILIRGLGQIRKEIESGQFRYEDSLEDIHMHIESRLSEIAGKTARKLHTARSRNDQVALDIRMWLRAETREVTALLRQLRKTLTELAKQHLHTVLPGYTHLQRAQPVLLSHHFMAYYEMFQRDTERFADCLKRINVMPLGSAALAGTTYPIDRHYTAQLLDFPKVSANSMDTVADRDFAIEFLSAASICMMHLSRMSEELILWSSSEFAFIEISDAFTTGSSIMPQKKNPDVCELVRGKTGRVYGDLITLLTLMKSLPMCYNRDMQEDKEPLFDAADTLKLCLAVFDRMLPHIRIKSDVMTKAAESGFLNATDMADYLVNKGIPFREAHSIAGKAVAYAISRQKELHELSVPELKDFSDLFAEDLFDYLGTEQMLSRRQSFGGTAKENVKQAIALAQENLKNEEE
ncbi:MAG: argininosuccinate lyase [Desulfococcaceae bacterium]